MYRPDIKTLVRPSGCGIAGNCIVGLAQILFHILFFINNPKHKELGWIGHNVNNLLNNLARLGLSEEINNHMLGTCISGHPDSNLGYSPVSNCWDGSTFQLGVVFQCAYIDHFRLKQIVFAIKDDKKVIRK
jgi:hypothetical protein